MRRIENAKKMNAKMKKKQKIRRNLNPKNSGFMTQSMKQKENRSNQIQSAKQFRHSNSQTIQQAPANNENFVPFIRTEHSIKGMKSHWSTVEFVYVQSGIGTTINNGKVF